MALRTELTKSLHIRKLGILDCLHPPPLPSFAREHSGVILLRGLQSKICICYRGQNIAAIIWHCGWISLLDHKSLFNTSYNGGFSINTIIGFNSLWSEYFRVSRHLTFQILGAYLLPFSPEQDFVYCQIHSF